MKVELRDLVVHFGDVRALEHVDVTFEPGTVTALVGPNGAGKSTLLGVLLGLVRPQAGSVRIDGTAHRLGQGYRHRLGYLPERVSFAETLTGRQVLRFFARARGVASDRVERVLDRVGLAGGPARRAVRGYSRGMRQRLGLGVAILAEPELLVMDEPTGGLDQQGLAVLWDVLEEWRAHKRTVVVTTHDLTLVERRVDVVMVLSQGRRRACGSPEALRHEAALPARVHVDFDDAAIARTWAEGLVARAHTDVVTNGPRVSMQVPHGGLHTVLGLINGEGRAVQNVRVEEPGLDDIYARILEEGP